MRNPQDASMPTIIGLLAGLAVDYQRADVIAGED